MAWRGSCTNWWGTAWHGTVLALRVGGRVTWRVSSCRRTSHDMPGMSKGDGHRKQWLSHGTCVPASGPLSA